MPKDDKKENISIKIGNAIKSLKKIYQNTNQNDEIENNENNNIPNSVVKLVNKHVKLDQAYRRKHNELTTLFNEYVKLYKKAKSNSDIENKKEYQHGLNTIHSTIKKNSRQMHRGRLLLIGKLKDDKSIEKSDRNYLADKLSVIFGFGKLRDKKTKKGIFHLMGNNNTKKKPVTAQEVDDAYLKKHNELMGLFKAYQKLYGKVLKYKKEVDDYRSIKFKSSISRNQMNRMIGDERKIMRAVDKMQDNLIDRNILKEEERIDTREASCPDDLDMFNDSLRDQINGVLKNNNNDNITNAEKRSIENIISEKNELSRHKKIRKIIAFKRK